MIAFKSMCLRTITNSAAEQRQKQTVEKTESWLVTNNEAKKTREKEGDGEKTQQQQQPLKSSVNKELNEIIFLLHTSR